MKLLLIFLLAIGLVGCHGSSSEQLCYEANKAVAEASINADYQPEIS
jgi:hypothetical protein